MKTRNIIHVFLLALVAGFSSCTKESDNETPANDKYYMKFKIDGVQKNYGVCGITISTTNDLYAAALAGSNENGNEAIGIALYSLTPIVSGDVFTGKEVNTVLSLPGAVINYVSTSGVTNSYSSFIVNDDGQLTNFEVFLKIYELTETTVKGSFYGDIFNIENNNRYSITGGEFYGIKQ